ncbi:MAG: aspartate-semialdehyde dehydrogenase [Clostridia bacterium]|nr:aspartate-semialdehyde dehydrogenase [Clostridia bacterium]
MKKYNLAILGATGAVGMEMMKVLEERNFPVENLRLLASERSVGKELTFCGKTLKVELACDTAFDGVDIVLGAAQNAIAKQFAPAIVKAGAVFVDNSSAFRMLDEVPLVVPEINAEDVKNHKGIIANPNCSTIITLTAINAINKVSKIESIIASTYQAVSGAGVGGPAELSAEVDAIYNGTTYEPKVFSHQIAYNVIPKIGGEAFEGYTSEEMKLQNESRKIMHLPALKATCTCVRVPVMRSHSISATIITERAVSVEEARNAISNGDGVKLVDDIANNVFPMPLDTSDQDIVFVGRIRRDLTNERGLSIWCCGDQVRKGAATNAVQIAEKVIELNAFNK